MSRNSRIDSNRLVNLAIGCLVAVAIVATSGCDKNYLASFVTTPNDESLLFSAKDNIRGSDYTSAISDCASISASALSSERFATVCASAYAGRCGFTMDFMTTNLPYTGATPPWAPWGHFMIHTLGATSVSAIADCDSAEAVLRGIGGPTARSADANFFMVALSLYKIGVIAKSLGDPTNTGSLSGAFNACAISSAAGTNYQQMTGEAVWDLLTSAGQMKSDPLIGTAATAIAAQCTVLSTINEDLCAATDPTVLTAAQIKGGLSTLKEGAAFGVNQCNNGASALTCNCP